MQTEVKHLEFLAFIKAIIIVTLTYVGIKEDVFYLLNGAFFFDTLFGLIKAIRLNKKITWNDFIWGIIVKYCILFIPFAVAVFAKIIAGSNMLYVVNVFVVVIVSNEMISIIANILSIRLKEDIKNDDFVAMALRALQNFFSRYIKRMLDSVKIDKVLPIKRKNDNQQ